MTLSDQVTEVGVKYLAGVAMEVVPVGYKQTEEGVIPEDWDVDKIGKLISITTGNKNTQDRIDTGVYNFINMIYFLCGKLKFDYPLYFT